MFCFTAPSWLDVVCGSIRTVVLVVVRSEVELMNDIRE